jgi:hypothetical protein
MTVDLTVNCVFTGLNVLVSHFLLAYDSSTLTRRMKFYTEAQKKGVEGQNVQLQFRQRRASCRKCFWNHVRYLPVFASRKKRYNRKQKYMSSEFHVKETSRRTHTTHLALTVLNVWIPARLNMVSAEMMMEHIYRIFL